MIEKRIQKFPGRSWIVVGQKSNLFIAGDKSHPKADEYFKLFEGFGNMDERRRVCPRSGFTFA